MNPPSRLLTLDSNVLIATLKHDEPYNTKCIEILEKVPDKFVLTEPSIIYQEVCEALTRKVGKTAADKAKEQLDLMIHPSLLTNCDKAFCASAYPLCAEYNIYAIDTIYFKTPLDKNAILVSLDKEDFIENLNQENRLLKLTT